MRRLVKITVFALIFSFVATASVWAQVLQNKQQPYKFKSAIQLAEEGKKQAAETAKKYGIGQVPSYLNPSVKSKRVSPQVNPTATTTAKTSSKPRTSSSSGSRKKTSVQRKSRSSGGGTSSATPTTNTVPAPISDENLDAARNARGFETSENGSTSGTGAGTTTAGTSTSATSSSGSTTTITTTEHTQTETKTSTSSSLPTTSVETGSSGKKSGEVKSGASGSQTESSDKKTKTDKDKKDEKSDVTYTGVYNDRQIIPNSMAIFCKTNAEDMLKETQKLYDCVNKIVQKINNRDAVVRQEGSQELSGIRYEELKTMLAQAITKGATISNYEKIQNDTGKAASKTKTEHEDNVAIANTISTLTDVINSMRDLYAERLKAEAITGIASVDPSVIADIKNEDDGKSDQIDSENKSNNPTVNSSSTTITAEDEEDGVLEAGQEGEWRWVRDNLCRRNIVTTGLGGKYSFDLNPTPQGTYEDGICPDGVYKTSSDDSKVYCQNGSCREIYMSGKCGDDSLTMVSNVKPVQLMGTAKCTDGTKEVPCADGIYVLDGYYYACKGGSCERCSGVATVTPSSSSVSETAEATEENMPSEEELNEARSRHLTGASSSNATEKTSSATPNNNNVLSDKEAEAARKQRGYGASLQTDTSTSQSSPSDFDAMTQARQRRGY